MKQIILLISFLGFTFNVHAQQSTFKLNNQTQSFQQNYQQTPLVIDTKKAEKAPKFVLPQIPNILWKHHPETVSFYNNHPSNPLCFNQSNGWEMIQVRPMKHQLLYDAAAIGTGLILGSILEALSK